VKAPWVVLIGVAAALSGCRSQEAVAEKAERPQPPVEVRTGRIEERRVERTVDVAGSLLGRDSADLSFEVTGRLLSIGVDFGHRVKQGQEVARLDAREFDLQAAWVRGALAQALARLGLGPDGDAAKVERTPALRQARAQLEDARSKYESAAQLVKTGDISQLRFVEMEKALRAREAALEAAEDELRTQRALIESLRAELALAEEKVADTILAAPFDGEVTARLVSAGQYVKENTPVARMVKSRPLRLRAVLPEAAAGAVRAGMGLRFRAAAVPEREFRGAIEELNPSLDAQTRSLTVEARLVDDDPRLRPGMFVNVTVVTAAGAPALLAPREAVYEIAGVAKVFVIESGKAVERRVRPGAETGGWRELSGEGVAAGQQVAVSNLNRLESGRAVTVK